MADALEEFQDQLQAAYMGWILEISSSCTRDQKNAVSEFLAYAIDEAKKAITVPRIGGSYEECRRAY